MSFTLSPKAINPPALLAAMGDTAAGACVTFEGRVRAQNDGRAVKALEYEAYAPLAEKEGARIMAELAARFPVIRAVCVHRTGRLELGELAVWVAVSAAHRGAAFEACRFAIDQVKERVPIWKKEHYADGSTEWINCAPSGPASVPPGMK
jgi:molybdopterin synthase catalytic subunit